jgi:hypothetical protein
MVDVFKKVDSKPGAVVFTETGTNEAGGSVGGGDARIEITLKPNRPAHQISLDALHETMHVAGSSSESYYTDRRLAEATRDVLIKQNRLVAGFPENPNDVYANSNWWHDRLAEACSTRGKGW